VVPGAVVPGCGCEVRAEQFGFVDQGERAFVLSAGERFPGLRRQAGRCLPVAVRGCFRLVFFGVVADLGVGSDVVADPALLAPGDVKVVQCAVGQPGRRVLSGAVAGGVPADGGGQLGFAFGCEADRRQALSLVEQPEDFGGVMVAGSGDRGTPAVADGGQEQAASVDEVRGERGVERRSGFRCEGVLAALSVLMGGSPGG
jgi:hypothetical protein